MLVKTVWKRSARSWIVKKTKGTNAPRPNKSGGLRPVPSLRSRPPHLAAIFDNHRRSCACAAPQICSSEYLGRCTCWNSRKQTSKQRRRVPSARKRKWRRYFEVDTRRRCLRMSFRCLFRSLRLLIAHNRYRNPTINRGDCFSGCSGCDFTIIAKLLLLNF